MSFQWYSFGFQSRGLKGRTQGGWVGSAKPTSRICRLSYMTQLWNKHLNNNISVFNSLCCWMSLLSILPITAWSSSRMRPNHLSPPSYYFSEYQRPIMSVTGTKNSWQMRLNSEPPGFEAGTQPSCHPNDQTFFYSAAVDTNHCSKCKLNSYTGL